MRYSSFVRGFNRICLVLAASWFVFVLVVAPIWIANWREGEADKFTLINPELATSVRKEATVQAVWRGEFADSPGMVILILVMPPLVGYGIARLIVAVVHWVANGFANEPAA